MTGCQLTDEDMGNLVQCPWNKLVSIWISYNSFGLKGIEHINSHKWPSLISLHLSIIDWT